MDGVRVSEWDRFPDTYQRSSAAVDALKLFMDPVVTGTKYGHCPCDTRVGGYAPVTCTWRPPVVEHTLHT